MIGRRNVTILGCMFMALVSASSVSAQAPTNSLERAIKELQAEIEHTRAEVKALREQQEKQAAQERRTKQNLPAKHVVVKKNDVVEVRIGRSMETLKQAELILAELDSGTIPKAQIPVEQKKVIAALVIERNALREKIRRQNNRRACRWFHLGCINKK